MKERLISMKKSLRILSLMISLIFILQFAPGFAESTAASEAIYTTSESSKDIEILLNKLDIIKDSGNDDDAVTKAQFIEYMINLMNISISPAKEQLFFDVPLTNKYADIVNTAYEAGLTKGNTDGTLAVDTLITANEAAVMAVRVLGAEIMLPAGADFTQYLGVATRLGVFDSVKSLGKGYLDRKAVCRVLFNILNSKCVATYNGEEFFLEDVTYMEEMYSVYVGEGVLETCQYGDIYGGSPSADGFVVIDGETYKYDNLEARRLLGHKVTYYYLYDRTISEPEILHMYSDLNRIATLDLEDVTSHVQGKLTYIDGDDKTRDLDLSSSALTLVNGRRKSVGSGGMAIPLYGSVTLVDNDYNGRYDVILYNQYELTLATGVNVDEKTVYSRSSKFGVIELEEYDAYYIFDQDGNPLDLSAITKDVVLNISENGDKNVMDITICTNVIDYKIASFETDTVRGYTVFCFGDDEGNELRTAIDFAKIYTNNSLVVSVDKNGVYSLAPSVLGAAFRLALDTDGKIAAVLEKADDSGYSFGYMMAAAPGGGISSKVEVRILTETDGVKDFLVADKIRLTEGEKIDRVTKSDFITKHENTTGVIRYKTDEEGLISAMEIAQASSENENVLRKDKEIPTGSSAKTRFYTSSNMIGGQVVIDEKTCVFVIPDQKSEYKDDPEWYYATKGTSLLNEKYYPGIVSYKGDNDIYADVLIMSTEERIVKNSMVMLVEKIVYVTDAESGETYHTLEGYVNGNKMRYMIEDTSKYPVPDAANTFRAEKGDVIRFSVNFRGFIGLIHPIFDYSASVDNDDKTKHIYNYDVSSTARPAFGDTANQVYGTMNEIYEGVYMNVENADDSEQIKYYYPITAATRFYEFDSKQSKYPISSITANDILTKKAHGAITDKVLIVTRESTTPLVVVYK